MRLICSYCRREYGETEPLAEDGPSHGICEACFEHYSAQWDGQAIEDYLEGFPFPVLAVGADSRIAAVNELASSFVDRPKRKMRGFLGGEAMECVHARLPEGCGRTEHCRTCTIRRTVMDSHESGRSHRRVLTTLNREDGPVQFWVSTELLVPPEGDVAVVIVTVEEIDTEAAPPSS